MKFYLSLFLIFGICTSTLNANNTEHSNDIPKSEIKSGFVIEGAPSREPGLVQNKGLTLGYNFGWRQNYASNFFTKLELNLRAFLSKTTSYRTYKTTHSLGAHHK